MALQVTISGTTQIYFGGQTVLTASVVDTETGQTPAGLQYNWNASQGRFVGATNGASVTYHADFTGNTDQPVTITCEVTLARQSQPDCLCTKPHRDDRTRHHRSTSEHAHVMSM